MLNRGHLPVDAFFLWLLDRRMSSLDYFPFLVIVAENVTS
jgi:hypothetical protein